MPHLTPILDHVVVNVADRLDDASALYRRLGFQLTERGHHSLGSSNHLAIFGENYLELLGYEPSREALWQAPPGLSGLVWKTRDADAIYRHLQQRQLADAPPASFFRPVTLPDGRVQEARFRTVRLQASRIPDGRSFFCQHLTPDAVWQDAWRQHPNSALDIDEFVIVADDPAHATEVYRQLFAPLPGDALEWRAGVARVRFLRPAQALDDFGALPADYHGAPRMAALGFRVGSLARVEASLRAGALPFTAVAQGIVVAPGFAFNLALRFRQG